MSGRLTVSRNPKIVRLIFALVLVAFPAQLLVNHFVGQPYPGLIQPAFAGTPLESGILTAVRPDVTVEFEDGSHKSIPYDGILPASRLNKIKVFRSAFRDDQRATDPRTVAWLRERFDRWFPRKSVTKMVIKWEKVSYDESASWRPSRKVLKVVTVPLVGNDDE